MEFRSRSKYQRIRLACRFSRGFMSWWLEVLVQVWRWWVWISTAVDNCFSPCLVMCAGPGQLVSSYHSLVLSLSSSLPPSALVQSNEAQVRGMMIALLLLVPFQEENCGAPEAQEPSQGCWALLLPSRKMHWKGLPSKQSTWDLWLPSGSEC